MDRKFLPETVFWTNAAIMNGRDVKLCMVKYCASNKTVKPVYIRYHYLSYLNKWVELMYFKPSIILLLMIQQIWHNCHVVLNILTQRNSDRLTTTMRIHLIVIQWWMCIASSGICQLRLTHHQCQKYNNTQQCHSAGQKHSFNISPSSVALSCLTTPATTSEYNSMLIRSAYRQQQKNKAQQQYYLLVAQHSVRDGQIYIRGTIFHPHPNSNLINTNPNTNPNPNPDPINTN